MNKKKNTNIKTKTLIPERWILICFYLPNKLNFSKFKKLRQWMNLYRSWIRFYFIFASHFLSSQTRTHFRPPSSSWIMNQRMRIEMNWTNDGQSTENLIRTQIQQFSIIINTFIHFECIEFSSSATWFPPGSHPFQYPPNHVCTREHK